MIERRGVQGDEQATGQSIPPELLLRRDRQLRFERGGIVYATDGRIGVLKQVVVDEVAGEVVELIVKLDRSDHLLSLPPEIVDKTAGSAVFLMTNRDATTERRYSAPAHPTRLVKVDHKTLMGKESRLRDRLPRPRRAIAQAGKDYVETPPLPGLERVEHRVSAFAPGAD
jgi:hypothetical protein